MPNNLRQHRIVDPVLTTFVQGFVFPELVGHMLFPEVLVDKEGVKVPTYGKEAFMSYNTTRAPRARVQRVDYGTGHIDVVLQEESVEMATDKREQEESALDAERTTARMVERIIQLTHERKVAELATAAGSYAGNTKALAAGQQWSHADSDPIADVEEGKEAIRAKVGIRPNTMVLGPLVYKALKHHPDILDRIKYSQKGVATAALLAEIFDLKAVVVAEAITADDAGNFSDIWGKNAVLAYVADKTTADLGQPSFGYTMRKRGRPNASKYYDEGVKSTVVQVEDIFACKVLGAGAGYLIRTAVA